MFLHQPYILHVHTMFFIYSFDQCQVIWSLWFQLKLVDQQIIKLLLLFGCYYQRFLPARGDCYDFNADYLFQKSSQIRHNMTLRPQKVIYSCSQHFFFFSQTAFLILMKKMSQDCVRAKNCHHSSFPHSCWPVCQSDKLNSALRTRVCSQAIVVAKKIQAKKIYKGTSHQVDMSIIWQLVDIATSRQLTS